MAVNSTLDMKYILHGSNDQIRIQGFTLLWNTFFETNAPFRVTSMGHRSDPKRRISFRKHLRTIKAGQIVPFVSENF